MYLNMHLKSYLSYCYLIYYIQAYALKTPFIASSEALSADVKPSGVGTAPVNSYKGKKRGRRAK